MEVAQKELVAELKSFSSSPSLSELLDVTIKLMQVAGKWPHTSGRQKKQFVIETLQAACPSDAVDQAIPHLIDLLISVENGQLKFNVPEQVTGLCKCC
jgi:hypothetical protein